MSTTIKPTVGRVVLIFFAATASGAMEGYVLPTTSDTPVPGLVTRVHSDTCINVAAFDVYGTILPLTSVRLLQDGEERPNSGCWAEWMPYQIGHAKKAEDREHDAKQMAIASDRAADDRRMRAGVLDMALRTPGLANHQQVLEAAEAYQAHIDGEKTTSALPASHPVQQLADAIGGTIEHVERLPDGSGAAVMSLPLPASHWLTQPGYNVPPMPFRRGTDDPERQDWAEKISAAGRYAVRCATMNGTENDFDPDALVQNLVVGMIGYFTPNGLSSDADANPPGAA